MKKAILIIAALLLIAIATAAGYLFNRIGSRYGGDDVRLYFPAAADGEAIRDSLVTHLGSYGEDVYLAWRLLRSNPRRIHGSYVVAAGERAVDFARALRAGNQTPVKITFNNVRTMQQLAEKISAKMEWDADDFMAACDSVLPPKGYRKAEFPAAFLPDTYEFFWTAPAVNVVARLSAVRDDFWNDCRRDRAKSLGLSPVKVAVLASIVEEETAKRDEQPLVARLYINRLNRGMLLQADPTVKFALGDFDLRRIYKAHLTVDSPYNTYLYNGLPPGPIRIPERSALEAVLQAPSHPYIYMCAKDDFSGYHDFAADLDTHNRNAARYHRALSHRNIR